MPTPAPREDNTPVYPRLPTADLLLDPKNPRLIEYGIDEDCSQDELLQVLWDEFAVKELAMSIAYNGYFNHEPLFIEIERELGSIVIEGNRRLAAGGWVAWMTPWNTAQ
ncbi:MAG: hypothetical protein JNK63_08615 [Chthonomonas sp.]|nr:hypothetical protein [Chthonomonas sp.]